MLSKAIEYFRKLRSRSRFAKYLHSLLREPYYSALTYLFPCGILVELPGQCPARVHPRFLGIRPDRYEPDFSAALDKQVEPGMTVLDIGAHVGLHTLRFCRKVGARGHVVAVEPSPANAALLRKHLAWNNCRNATVIEAAVSEHVGELEFAFRPDPTDSGAFANSLAYDVGGQKARVRVVTIDDICRTFVPNVIKIDVEGAELLAVRGARETIARFSPVILIAIHPDAMAAIDTSPMRLVRLLEECGYKGRHLDGRPAVAPGFEEIIFARATSR